jgi:mRNA degradation ribonuclease J1/J2
MKKNRRVILVLNDIYKRGTFRDYLLFLAQKERKHIQQSEINKLNKSDAISSVCTCTNAQLEKDSLVPVYCHNCNAYVQTDL